jgi:hypothetical protein
MPGGCSEWVKEITKIGELLAENPGEPYETLRDRLVEARRVFHEVLAKRIEVALNDRLRAGPRHRLEDKHLLAYQLNQDCRLLGIAVSFGDAKQPARLLVDEFRIPECGKFQLISTGSHGPRHRMTIDPDKERLTLVGHPNRREAASERWAAKHTPRSDRSR